MRGTIYYCDICMREFAKKRTLMFISYFWNNLSTLYNDLTVFCCFHIGFYLQVHWVEKVKDASCFIGFCTRNKFFSHFLSVFAKRRKRTRKLKSLLHILFNKKSSLHFWTDDHSENFISSEYMKPLNQEVSIICVTAITKLIPCTSITLGARCNSPLCPTIGYRYNRRTYHW